MDIADIKIAKEAMEQQVSAILNEFLAVTGVRLYSVDTYQNALYGTAKGLVYGPVTFTSKIELV